MPLITCKGLTVSYDRRIAVSDVSFTVDDGDYLAVIGKNGSGKSTLIKALLGLIPVQSGTISFDGIKQSQVGYLPQQTAAQRDFPASVYEVILSGCLNSLGGGLFYKKQHKELALKKAEQLGLSDVLAKSYRDLSGGQQQRVLLARALCATDKLVILDEPVASLDPVVTAEFYDILHKLNRENGVTVIMVSHDVLGIKQSATKVLQLDTETAYFGSFEEYSNTETGRQLLGGGADV